MIYPLKKKKKCESVSQVFPTYPMLLFLLEKCDGLVLLSVFSYLVTTCLSFFIYFQKNGCGTLVLEERKKKLGSEFQ